LKRRDKLIILHDVRNRKIMILIDAFIDNLIDAFIDNLIDAFIDNLIDSLSVVSYRKQIDMRGDFPCMRFFLSLYARNTGYAFTTRVSYVAVSACTFWRHNLKSRALYLTETLLEPYTVRNMSLCWYFHLHFLKFQRKRRSKH